MQKLFRKLPLAALIVGLSLCLYGCSNTKSGQATQAQPAKQTLAYPESWDDKSIFRAHYQQAALKLKTMSLDEKIGQLFLVRTPERDAKEIIQRHQLGGYILYKRDIDGNDKTSLKEKINSWVRASKINPMIAVDEEGGTVVRISSNTSFRATRFPSPQQLYAKGGMEAIVTTTKEMVQLFEELGINVNLAPVADISNNPEDFIYKRSFGKDAAATASFIATVIKNTKGSGVSFAIKHFPGYGNNRDTHKEVVGDKRSLEELKAKDLVPFKAGAAQGAEAILVSHNVVNAVDSQRPASLSKAIIKLAREECGFTGIVMTDNLDMRAIKKYTPKGACVEAFLAGNDVIMITDYATSIKEMQDALQKGSITEEALNRRVFRILAWKYYKGIIKSEQHPQ